MIATEKPAGAKPPAGRDTSSRAEFAQFMRARRAAGGKASAVPAKPIAPTEERLGKPDKPKKTGAGFHRAPAPIERMRNHGLLDPKPKVNEAMFTASQKLQESFYNSGLAEHIRTMDFAARGASGPTTSASHMPASEFAAHHRQKFRDACDRLGWYPAHPMRGCGRLVVDVICRECTLEDAGRRYFPGTRNEAAISAAKDRLKEGLFILAVHWKLV